MFENELAIRESGFDGFQSIEQLRSTKLQQVPGEMGVYLIIRRETAAPLFLSKSTGGHFKGKDPTVDLVKLQQAWVSGSPAVYIGKAGGLASKSTLRSRLSAYFRFGLGVPCGHWGGRYIWQLPDADKLIVCWKRTGSAEPREVEKKMISDFVLAYKARPYANRVD